VTVTSFGLTADTAFDIGGHTLRHGDLLGIEQVQALHEAEVVWDTAQGWFVNRRVAFKPAVGSTDFAVVDLARLH
jgi:hypothetical protein